MKSPKKLALGGCTVNFIAIPAHAALNEGSFDASNFNKLSLGEFCLSHATGQIIKGLFLNNLYHISRALFCAQYIFVIFTYIDNIFAQNYTNNSQSK
jgi:hypothetical protein